MMTLAETPRTNRFQLSPLPDPPGGIDGAGRVEGAPSAHTTILLCATPRSGSWLLAAALDATDIGGHAREYLRADYRELFLRAWRCSEDVDTGAYLDLVVRAGTSANGVSAVKAHWPQYEQFARSLGAWASPRLPGVRHVLITRRDKARQAVSWYRALETDEWWVVDGTPRHNNDTPEGPVDLERVAQLEGWVRTQEDRWRAHFAELGVRPLEVAMEDFVVDLAGTVSQVLVHAGVDVPSPLVVPSPRMTRQADARSDMITAQYAASGPAVRLHPSSPAPRVALSAVLANRRWMRRTVPFPHVIADNVFTPDIYERLGGGFREILKRPRGPGADGFNRNMPGYDAWGWNFPQGYRGPLEVLLSKEWHDLIASVLGIKATGHLTGGLHHHEVDGRDGQVHNDYNPVWFPAGGYEGEIRIARADLVDYSTGDVHQDGIRPRQLVRAGAMILFLNNPVWSAGDGGETGLYRAVSDRVGSPTTTIAPRNNRLVLFESTPWSFHSYLANRKHVRNSVILWLHRDPTDAVAQWGERGMMPFQRR